MDTTREVAAGRMVGIGAGFGAFVGILATLLANVEITNGIVFGAGAGVLVGLLTAALVNRGLARGRDPNPVSVGARVGIVVGGAVGLLVAWALAVDPVGGLGLGAGGGLAVGLFLGRMLVTPVRPGGGNRRPTSEH